MRYKNIREEELKNKVGADWFKSFDTTEILGAIDFTVFPKQKSILGRTPLLWAEAKTGDFDVPAMFVQLILTIGKARTFDKTMPPAFLGAFDFKKIAFVPYISVQDIFYINDFNWNVAPSNHESKEFKIIKTRVEETLKKSTYIYDYQNDEKELKYFIANNITKATESNKLKIDKNNFIPIYLRWLEIIKPIIDVNWAELKSANILDSDFYLADLFVDDKDTHKLEDDLSLRNNLFVVFQNQGYKIAKENTRQMFDATINIKSKETYQQFWKIYKRPPIKEFQDYIIERRDLLVPQDIRERKGAFFTPFKWVELSQKYLADQFGENWQEEYFVWDCAAGTGNLLTGLTNKYNIYASTLDMADVNVMKDRILNGANLLEGNVFQFDFLNDDFSKLPKGLLNIINDDEKRKKLIIYINPPYAEATTAKTVSGTGSNKTGVATRNSVSQYYNQLIGNASNELFALFMSRIFEKIPDVILAQFSTLKFVSGSNFKKFKEYFKSDFKSGFIVPADTFDNVKGKFPIGFTIWQLNKSNKIQNITCDIFNETGKNLGEKIFYAELPDSINKWIKIFDSHSSQPIGLLVSTAPDFQHNNQLAILSKQQKRYCFKIDINNLLIFSVYFAVRNSITANWINDRDQFLYPNEGWINDFDFQNNCFAFTLFSNTIQSQFGINHWIPFTEYEVNAQAKFESDFMTKFIQGAFERDSKTDLFSGISSKQNAPLVFSIEAKAVFDAGRELWKYYHTKPNVNINASLYDIREYFQGRNANGKMNNKSDDLIYMQLISSLRSNLKSLTDVIAPKVYEYGFLKE
jgi:hypothetical protein